MSGATARFRIRHRTRYQYSLPVTVCQNETHLAPRTTRTQRCLSHALHVTPKPAVSAARLDYFGNLTTYFAVQELHEELDVVAESVIELTPAACPPLAQTPAWEKARDSLRRDPTLIAEREFLLDSPFAAASAELAEYAALSFPPRRPIGEAAVELMRRIHVEFRYDPQFTTIATPLTQVLRHRRGVCQDFAHLMIGALRSLGLAARYVSGYLETVPADGVRLIGADASHAWASACLPGFGWMDLDPTNAQIPSDRHIAVAWGRDYGDVTPLKGVILGGGRHNLFVAVDVERESVFGPRIG